MRIGILGSGLMGSKLGTLFARAGHDVVFSYARSMDKLKRLAKDAGHGAGVAGTPREAADDADAVLLAVPWLRMDDVLKQAGDLKGKVILTCSLPMDEGNTGLVSEPRIPGRRNWPGKSRRQKSSAPSIRFQAKSSSVCMRRGERKTGRALPIATTRPARKSPPV